MGVRGRITLATAGIFVVMFAVIAFFVTTNVSTTVLGTVESGMDETLYAVTNHFDATNDAEITSNTLVSYTVALDGGVLVMGPNGVVISSSGNLFVGNNLSLQPWYVQARAGTKELFEFSIGMTEVYGKSVVYKNMTVLTYVPRATVDSQRLTPTLIIIVIGVVALIVLINLLHSLIMRNVVRPIDAISEELEEAGQGSQLDGSIAGSTPELRALVGDINTMLGRLDRSGPSDVRFEPSAASIRAGLAAYRDSSTSVVDSATDSAVDSAADSVASGAADQTVLEPTAFSLSSYFDHSIHQVKQAIAAKRLKLSVYIDRAIPTALIANEDHLSQVLITLLNNAIMRSSAGGLISIVTELVEQKDSRYTVKLSVQDAGLVLSSQQARYQFGASNQQATAIPYNPGTDMASILQAKATIESMGGDLWADSEFDKGVVFHFTFTVESTAMSEGAA